jgi:hypothetical protein
MGICVLGFLMSELEFLIKKAEIEFIYFTIVWA